MRQRDIWRDRTARKVYCGKDLPGVWPVSDVTSIALSGLSAQARRLEATASNTANSSTRGVLPDKSGGADNSRGIPAGQPQAYAAVGVSQTAIVGGGTRASLVALDPATIAEYAPDESYADADGMVAAPNVDPVGETLARVEASNAYRANVAVLKTGDEMTRESINLKA